MGSVRVALALLAAVTAPAHAPAQAAGPPEDAFFVVMPWNAFHGWGPRRIDRTEGLKSIAECGFNVAGFVEPSDLPACEALGLKALIASPMGAHRTPAQWAALPPDRVDAEARRLVDRTAGRPSVLGYFVADEPRADHFPALGRITAAIGRLAPGKIAYVNLYPNHASVQSQLFPRLQTRSYAEYVERFVTEARPQVLSYDNYIVQHSKDMTDPALAPLYYTNLAEVRAAALKHGLPFWNVVVCNQIRPWSTVPSPANLMLQAYTTMAAGAHGVCWYTYYGGGYAYAPVDDRAGRTPTWRYLQAVNHHLTTLGPIITRLRSTGIYFTTPVPHPDLPALPGRVLKAVRSAEPAMVGEFAAPDGTLYAMVVNLSLAHSALVKVDLAEGRPGVSAASAEDGQFRAVDLDAGVWLVPGQGVLLRVMPPGGRGGRAK